MADRVRCSVVIPCRNGAATLGRQLDALIAQEAPVPFEVVVADNGSTDGSRRVAEARGPLVRVVDASHAAGINVARNAGVQAAQGELLLLCDADDVVHPGWLAAHWAAFSAGAALLGGSLRRTTPDGEQLGWQRALNDDLGFLPWPTGANCGLARSVLDEVGLFDETLRGGADETEFFWRAQLRGHRLQHVDAAVIDYVARPTARGAFRQSAAFGRSHAWLFAHFREQGMPRPDPRRSALIWLRMVRKVFTARFAAAAVRDLTRYSGVLSGRVRGSIRYRVRYV